MWSSVIVDSHCPLIVAERSDGVGIVFLRFCCIIRRQGSHPSSDLDDTLTIKAHDPLTHQDMGYIIQIPVSTPLCDRSMPTSWCFHVLSCNISAYLIGSYLQGRLVSFRVTEYLPFNALAFFDEAI